MAAVSYVVLAKRSDALALLDAWPPLDRFEGYVERVLEPGRWAVLAWLLGFNPAEVHEMRTAAPLAEGHPHDGPWVFDIPAALLERLAELGADARALSEEWFYADTFMHDETMEYVFEVLSRLRDIAVRARALRTDVLLAFRAAG